jgi:nitrous oxidase accessory protein
MSDDFAPGRRTEWRRLGLLLGILLVLSYRSWVAIPRVSAQTEVPVIRVTAESLAMAVANAKDGDIIEVDGGTHHGSLEINKRLTLIGLDWPILDGGNQGTVLKISGPGTVVRGFLIKNSGSSLDQENAGIALEAVDGLVEGNRFQDTLFGIYLRQANDSIVRGNVISSKDLDVPRRGDPIRVWYSNDVLIEKNVIEKGRDVVLWYSERLTIRHNEVSDGRYGLHFMYCDDANVHHNRLLNNSVGAFMMYSRRVTLQNNTIAYNRGPSGYGIGLKDMDDTIVMENLFLDNRIGAHLDTSPREVDSIGQFTGNVFAYNDIGVQMMPSVRHNEFTANSFVDNGEQVAIAGGGQLRENSWTVAEQGNYWSDYAGYDANTDGLGDFDYKSERLFEDLVQRRPDLRLFLYSPATNAIDFAAKAFPLVRPQPKLTDSHPLMSPRIPTDAPALPQATNSAWYGFSLLLLVIISGLVWLPRLGWQRYHFTSEADR